ncbi:MAG: lysine--tRNA ligase, partial [Clostridia bacterium]|nr:lysine--tRNA ligase [Clostridia bacterium]
MENNENLLVEDYGEQVRIRREKLSALTQEGKNPYEQTKFIVDATSNGILGDFANYENKSVRIAGRILSRRMMGKASFAHLLDSKGKIQIYVKRDNVGEEVYAEWKKADIGDIYGIEGTVFMTHSGEVSVSVTAMTMLSKSLLPLPEKFHGLKDNDLRYRQRYVDLIANPEVKENFVVRSRIIKAIRDLLDSKGFVEVETPVLNTIAGGASARPFITHHNTLDLNMYMRIAPELYLKRLIVGGFDKVYEIGKMFRNEGMDVKHNPEFTMMELYQAYADYNDMMDITEEIYHAALTAAGKGDKITYEGVEIDLTSPWERLTMLDAIKRYVGIDFD